MGKQIQFDYYYGIEAEQFSFYRVPRLLIKDERFKGLSSDAKLLYGLMLDRMSLSMKNGWLDEENRAYIIYTLDNVMEDLGCAKATCDASFCQLNPAFFATTQTPESTAAFVSIPVPTTGASVVRRGTA